MSEEGFIKLHRSILSWEWADDSTVFFFFVRLIFAANYQEKHWHGMTIERGQFVTSLAKLCELTKFSKATVRRCLDCLTGTGEIKEAVIANRYRIITVVNYDKYQSVGQKMTNPKSKVGQKMTNRPSRVGQKLTNRPTNSPTPTKERKKYSSPLRGKNTAYPPARLGGGGRLAPEQQQQTEQKSGIVPLKELLTYAETVPDSQSKLVLEFHGGFEQSGTVMPEEWQDLYRRYVVADEEHRRQFIELLESGALRERWGDVHDTA